MENVKLDDSKLHEQWSTAVGGPQYSKARWRALEGAFIRSLSDREREAILEIATILRAHDLRAPGDRQWT